MSRSIVGHGQEGGFNCKKLFYPRVVLTGNVDTEQVAKEIAELSSLSTGDSKNVIDNLVTVMTRHLQSSESVTLDGLGTFRLTMKSTMNGVEDPLKVSATQSTLRVRFLPTSKRNLDWVADKIGRAHV